MRKEGGHAQLNERTAEVTGRSPYASSRIACPVEESRVRPTSGTPAIDRGV